MTRIDQAIAAGRHPLSLAHLTMIDADHLMLAVAALAGGFDAVGLRILPPRGTVLAGEIIGNRPVITEIKRIFADTGLGLYDAESFGLRAESDIERDYGPALELVGELGGRAILSSVIDPDRGRALENYVTLCDLAAPYGITVGLEYISFRDLKTLNEAVAFVAAASRPNSGVIVDALHHSRTRGTPAQITQVDPASLAYAQICDAAGPIPDNDDALLVEARTGRLIPGEGTLWLAEWLAALPPTLPIGVEAPVAALAGLSPVERGRVIGAATRKFLNQQA